MAEEVRRLDTPEKKARAIPGLWDPQTQLREPSDPFQLGYVSQILVLGVELSTSMTHKHHWLHTNKTGKSYTLKPLQVSYGGGKTVKALRSPAASPPIPRALPVHSTCWHPMDSVAQMTHLGNMED